MVSRLSTETQKVLLATIGCGWGSKKKAEL